MCAIVNIKPYLLDTHMDYNLQYSTRLPLTKILLFLFEQNVNLTKINLKIIAAGTDNEARLL